VYNNIMIKACSRAIRYEVDHRVPVISDKGKSQMPMYGKWARAVRCRIDLFLDRFTTWTNLDDDIEDSAETFVVPANLLDQDLFCRRSFWTRFGRTNNTQPRYSTLWRLWNIINCCAFTMVKGRRASSRPHGCKWNLGHRKQPL